MYYLSVFIHNELIIVMRRLQIINWQDWKYTLFVAFIRHSQNIRCHNALREFKLYGGCHRKHWIETSISKLIFNMFSFT